MASIAKGRLTEQPFLGVADEKSSIMVVGMGGGCTPSSREKRALSIGKGGFEESVLASTGLGGRLIRGSFSGREEAVSSGGLEDKSGFIVF